MSVIETLTQHNDVFSRTSFPAGLKIIPKTKTMILGCVDPRVDPSDIFGLELGDAAIIRNVGGRVTPDVFDTLAMLRVVAKAGGGDLGASWNLIVLHHTDCGITRLTQSPELLAKYFGVASAGLDALAINDPRASVAIDVAALKANPGLPAGFLVSGLVYDVATGRVETVVEPSLLRAE